MIVGTLDGLAAIIHYMIATGGNPARVFVYIASGVFGRGAFSSDPSIAWWGVVFHYLIAFSWTALFFVLYPKLKILSRNRLAVGLSYGVVVWLIMNLIVLPLSNVPPLNHTALRVMIGVIILMVCVGIPISFMAQKHQQGGT